jgi:hypothetical protein
MWPRRHEDGVPGVERQEVGRPGDFSDLTDEQVLTELKLAQAHLEETLRRSL